MSRTYRGQERAAVRRLRARSDEFCCRHCMRHDTGRRWCSPIYGGESTLLPLDRSTNWTP